MPDLQTIDHSMFELKEDEVVKRFSSSRFTWNLSMKAQVLFWLTLIFVLTGCAVEYGRLKQSATVTEAFESGRVFPDYNYYFRSWGTLPFIIAGIRDDYRLESKLWKVKDLNEMPLGSWVQQMDRRFGSDMHGSYIFDVFGKQIGVWYSSIRWATVKINNDNMTITLIPELPGIGRK